MNKKEFKNEYRKWRLYMRALNNTYHGQSGEFGALTGVAFESTECTSMMWEVMRENIPWQVDHAINNKKGRNSTGSYRELSSGLSKAEFHVRVLLNMDLPPSYRRVCNDNDWLRQQERNL